MPDGKNEGGEPQKSGSEGQPNTAAGSGTTAAAGSESTERTYSKQEFQQVVKDRDEAKRKSRELQEAAEKKDRDELAKKGEFEKLNTALTSENETLKSQAERAKEYEASLIAMLRQEAEGTDKDIAEAIITNTTLKIEDRFARVKALKEKTKGGSGTSPGTASGSTAPKQFTADEIAKMNPLERAKLAREELERKK